MIYAIIIFTGSLLARAVSLFDRKTRRFFSLRKGEIERISEYFNKAGKKRVIWFHSASAGELEQAKPIIEKLREGDSDYLIAASFFSSSGYDAGLKYDKVDFCFNLPLDYKRNAVQLLNCINPELIVYSKYDVWTNLTVQANKRGVRLALVSATLPEKSFRHRWPLRLFFKRAYSLLDRIYAISEGDAERFFKITGPANRQKIVVSGDTRFDRVKAVIDNMFDNRKKVLQKEPGCLYILAGSTYRESEKNLVPAIIRLNENNSNARLILVPHEIDDENIKRVCGLVRKNGLKPVLYSASSVPVSFNEKEVLIVDAYGVLAFLYSEADIIFVGGSFKGSVHSVLEPAIFGRPILTGPFIANSYEALALEKSGGLKVCSNADSLYNAIESMATEPAARQEASSIAGEFFKVNLGASDFIFKDMDRAFFRNTEKGR